MTNNETITPEFPEPSPDLIADVRKRLAEIPPDLAEYVNTALKQEPLESVANRLWKAGHPFMTNDLYEYRRTLFPPRSLVEPYTAGPPVLKHEFVDATSEPAQTNPEPQALNHEPNPLNSEPQTPNNEPAPSTSCAAPCPSVSGGRAPAPPCAPCNSAGHTLLDDLRDVIKRYVVLPEMAAEALALWVVHTYAFTLRPVTTYIGIVSPEKRCGKTTLLELLALLANRSLTAANISPSAMFRVIEHTQPTLLIDEADTFLEGRDELAGILNAGYRKGNSYVVRIAEGRARRAHNGGGSYTSPQPEFGEWTPDHPQSSSDTALSLRPSDFARYSCWCPKVMAAIGRLPDALADRCIIITMQRKLVGEKCERMRNLNAEDLRKRCAQFVHENSADIAEARPAAPPDLNDRAADIWEPLLAIADLAGGEWPELARQAAKKLSSHDDELTLTGYFLKDLRNLMVLANVDRMLCRDIVARLNPMHDRPWEDLRRGREINEWWLGRLLADLGVRSRSTRVNDATGKGYTLADIEAAFRRYVPNPDLHCQPTVAEQLTGEINLSKNQETQIEAQLDKMMKQFLSTLPKEPS